MIECVGAVRVSSEGAPIVHFGDDRWVCVEDRETAEEIGDEAAALAERAYVKGAREAVLALFSRAIGESLPATYDRPRRKYPRDAALALLAINMLETMSSEVLALDIDSLCESSAATIRRGERDE